MNGDAMPSGDPLAMLAPQDAARRANFFVHELRKGIVCDTDIRGYPTPHNLDPAEIVVDSSRGFISLWEPEVTLRYRFQEQSMVNFERPESAKVEIKKLIGEALLMWGEALPITFAEQDDLWDFEIAVRTQDKCSIDGCVLAAAFFPDAGRHELVLYPKMFEQVRAEQVETLAHEFGHVFGLRHFFASVSEREWPSEIFGSHSKFTIMNYGNLSALTATDKSDLKLLYQSAWNGQITHINGTPIQLVRPFHATVSPLENPVAATPTPSVHGYSAGYLEAWLDGWKACLVELAARGSLPNNLVALRMSAGNCGLRSNESSWLGSVPAVD